MFQIATLLPLILFLAACGVKGPPLPPLEEPETPNEVQKDSSRQTVTPTPANRR